MNFSALKRMTADDSATKALSNTGFSIVPSTTQANVQDLVLKGFLMPGWAGRLAAGLAEQRVSIVRGEAEKVTVSAWTSKFELQFSSFAKDPSAIDYVALANTELPQDRTVGKIMLLDFKVEPCERHEGSLYVELRGVDRLGFLGDLLDYFSMRCLFPVKMTVETVGNTALDRFWLKGVGGSRPSESIAEAVKENLAGLLIGTR
jgi:hypothetical protein